MTVLNVSGMSCNHCVRAITEAIRAVDADAAVSVDLQAGRVSTNSAVPRDRLAAAIVDEGYQVAAG